MCVSFKALNFPEPCQNPVHKSDGAFECPYISRVTMHTKRPFCCFTHIFNQDKCGSCTAAATIGDPRNNCNKSSQKCMKCGGSPTFCQNSTPKKDSPAWNLYKNRCCSGGSCGSAKSCTAPNHWCSHLKSRCTSSRKCRGSGHLYCNKNAVPRLVKMTTRLAAPANSRSTAISSASLAVDAAHVSSRNLNPAAPTVADDLETKSSIFFSTKDSSPDTVTADKFFMRITPVMPTGDSRACRERALSAGGCQPLCWYVFSCCPSLFDPFERARSTKSDFSKPLSSL